jgi:hypothetical protein
MKKKGFCVYHGKQTLWTDDLMMHTPLNSIASTQRPGSDAAESSHGPRSTVGVVARIPLPEEAALCFNCAAAAYSYRGAVLHISVTRISMGMWP